MTEKNPSEFDEGSVACDGGGDATGHPRVFLNFGEKGEVVCPYCSRQFFRKNRK